AAFAARAAGGPQPQPQAVVSAPARDESPATLATTSFNMMYLNLQWIVSNNIGFKDGCREPSLLSNEIPLIGELQCRRRKNSSPFSARRDCRAAESFALCRLTVSSRYAR